MWRVVSIGIARLDEGASMLSSLSMLADLSDFFPKPWVYIQVPALILLVVVIILYIRWKKKQM
jgi:hypothetical protein